MGRMKTKNNLKDEEMKLQKLLSADIYRDGGSLECTWLTDENVEWTVMLKIQNWQQRVDKRTYRLFNCKMDAAKLAVPVEKESEQHVVLLALIEEWLTKENLPFSMVEMDTTTTHGYHNYYLRRLLAELKAGRY